MSQFNRFRKVEYFGCDNCEEEFYETTAYSMASNWVELEYYPTYCTNCAKEHERQAELKAPPKIDKRTLNKTGRTHQLGTRVRKEFLKKLRKIARKEKLKYVEVLERALECYESRGKVKN